MSKRKKSSGGTAVAPFDRRLMEKMMRDINAFVAERQPGSIDEVNALIQEAMSKGGIPARAPEALSPLERAQELMYEAYDASGKRRIDLALEALAISRECVDAYVFLAEESAQSLDEAKDMYEKGVHAAEQLLGPKFFEENEGHFWGILETRPYMRAQLGLAQCLWTMGQRSEAINQYNEMLRLNPNDNQGVRDILAVCLIEENLDEPLGDLLKRYKEDASAVWRYTTALWRFRKEGPSAPASAALKEAVNENGFVPGYLLGVKKLPRRLPELVGFGDENEAIAYAASGLEGWKRTPGALEWLAKTLHSTRRR